MKILISSIGSRGDVQPILALAIELESLGHDARLCVAPNFKGWVESYGIECLAIGPDLKKLMGEAAHGCDVVMAAGALQFATRSVTEVLKIPYVFSAFCPAVLPSPDHPPPKMGAHHPQSLPPGENVALWDEEKRSWNALFRDALNEERAKLGLPTIDSVQRHLLTDHPWLAADPILAPAGTTDEMQIFQTGAWLLPDPSPLPAYIEEFLASGPRPVYFGFGSMRAAGDTSRILVESARALGVRAIISQGWGNLRLLDAGSDCLLVDDVAHEKLFPRVVAVVHHGGAGTTTVAARAGVPQLIVPHLYDQFYWAHRVQQLGVGAIGPTRDALSVEGITSALEDCMKPEIRDRAGSLGRRIERHGTRIAAEDLLG